MNKNITIGIMAHVDAGKTTLSEGLLYAAGVLRETGRVDHGDAFLDTYALEKERGITIFSKQAVLPIGTLIDTPGHVDFAPEAERVLGILDYAILVVSGTDGVQGHTRTLWRLLADYDVPVFIFVNKMDMDGADRAKVLSDLEKELSEGCVDIADEEAVALLDETVMESYLTEGMISDGDIRRLIAERRLFPCFFGSALRDEGVKEFYQALERFTGESCNAAVPADNLSGTRDDADAAVPADNPSGTRDEPENLPFSARVYKISRDASGTRLTHIRVVSGSLKPKQVVEEEKVDQLRRYSGEKYELLDVAEPGMVCALTGLKKTYPGQGLGRMDDLESPELEPVLNYRLVLPEEVAAVTFLPKIRELEEEQPELHIAWDPDVQEIHVRVMGQVQTEILQELIRERYGVEVSFGQPGIVYRETVTGPVEGIGHYEPLKHYAEVHVAIEPLPAGSGVVADSQVSTDELDLNWQRLILTHILEREHPGVLTGAPLTDVKISVIGGRAHLKHTEGGDFRQATYRAIRMGLMKTTCRVLEPYYDFRLTVPQNQIGRAMTDIERMSGSFTVEGTTLTGTAPVVTMQDYAGEVTAYTGGQGDLSLSFHGYLPCHNEEEVIAAADYDPEADVENQPGSVFCAHGAGYYVPWDEVEEKCHVHTNWRPETGGSGDEEESNDAFRLRMMDEALGVDEIDDILDRATQANRRTSNRSLRRAREKIIRKASKPSGTARPRKQTKKTGDYLLVDGYNVIHAWKELSELAAGDMDQARGRLQDILCNYQGFSGRDVILVFDAYRIASHPEEIFDYHNIHVVYTKTAETADQYIEKFSVEKAERYHVTVVTSDRLEQVIIRGAGAHLMSARDFEEEVKNSCTIS